MFRSAVLKSARTAASQAVRKSAIARPVASSFVTKSQFAPSQFQAVRCYSAAAGLQKTEVESRIIDLLNNFDKVGSILWSMELADGFAGFRPSEGTI
jgi:NADH dehydrogenase (ubiquinone) 1 alpha/beta subcomplex 1